MKAAIVGDVHCRVNLMYEKVQEHEGIEVIFQIGDFGAFPSSDRLDRATLKHDDWIPDFSEYVDGKREVPILTYFIKGNHEDFDFLQKYEQDNEITDNLIYLPNRKIIKINKTKIGALGGNWSWKFYEGGKKLKKDKRSYFSPDDVDFFRKHKVDILLLHACPRFINDDMHSSPRLTELIEEMQPRYAFHGHKHEYSHAKIGRTEVICLDTIYGKSKSIYILEIN